MPERDLSPVSFPELEAPIQGTKRLMDLQSGDSLPGLCRLPANYSELDSRARAHAWRIFCAQIIRVERRQMFFPFGSVDEIPQHPSSIMVSVENCGLRFSVNPMTGEITSRRGSLEEGPGPMPHGAQIELDARRRSAGKWLKGWL